MLHLLDISYDSSNDRIHLKGFDEESRLFTDGIKEDHPEGYILKKGESALEVILKTLQTLEGEFDQVYEVVSISEINGVIVKEDRMWRVWYRNKE